MSDQDSAPIGYTVETGTACLANCDNRWCRLLRGHGGDHDFGQHSAPTRWQRFWRDYSFSVFLIALLGVGMLVIALANGVS